MKAVIQRVSDATLKVDGEVVSQIGKGFVVYFGVEKGDDEIVCSKICTKISTLRIFEDEKGKMNLALHDVSGEILLVSQFTLFADCSRGNRPSFFQAEQPEIANKIYQKACKLLQNEGIIVKTGVFGADMKILQNNDGPVTIILNSKEL